MHSNTFLHTAGSILSKQRSNSKNKIQNKNNSLYSNNNIRNNNFTNTSNFISTAMNNRSITTNESSGLNNSSYYHNNNRRSFNPRIKKPYINNVPLNTVGTDKSTWYHTKTVASIMKEKQ